MSSLIFIAPRPHSATTTYETCIVVRATCTIPQSDSKIRCTTKWLE